MEQTTYQEQEIVATAGQRFENTHFIKCALKAFRAEFYNCTFTDCEFIEAVYTVLYECNFETVTVLRLAEKVYYNSTPAAAASASGHGYTKGVEFNSVQASTSGFVITGRNNTVKTVVAGYYRKLLEEVKQKAEQKKIQNENDPIVKFTPNGKNTFLHTNEPVYVQKNKSTLDKLGEAAFTLAKYEEAVEHFTNYLQENPEAARIVKRLAEAYTYLKQFGKAVQTYESYLRLEPAQTDIYLELAWNHYNHKENEKALQYLEQSVPRDADEYSFYFRKGQLYFNLKKYADAAHEFEKGLKINPYSAYGNSFIAAAYYEAGDYDKAMVYTKKALELEPDDKLYQKNYESLLNELGKQPTN
jgi:predicted Zn-dependent protease